MTVHVTGHITGHSLSRPRALRPGDRVAVLCVSSPVTNHEAFGFGLDALRFAGLEPVVYPSAREPGTLRPYLAGDDKRRASDLTDALTDPDIAGIMFAKGGYGAQRTLEAMDWGALTARQPAPKVIAGFSDITAILQAVATQLGWASLFSPTVANSAEASQYSLASLLRAVMRPEHATGIGYPHAVTVVPGVARGVTMGGTLALLASSIGTPTAARSADGGILLLEDVSEADFRIDRMLTQLRRSGYLDGIQGIVTGSFTDCGPREDIEAILVERLGDLGVPMISWADVGHGGPFQTFPIGIAAELDATARNLRLLDPPLKPAGAPPGPR